MKTRKAEWFDNASFWRELYPFMFPEKDMAEVDANMGKALKLAKPSGKTALDLCCGAGRYSIVLAKRGFSVTGVDKTKYLLDKVRESARAGRVRITCVQQDMRDFVSPDAFSFVLSMFSSFGYFENKADDMRVLGNIFASLEPGGVLLMDLMNMQRVARMPAPAGSHKLPDGSELAEQREMSEDWIRIRNERRITRNGKAHTVKSAVTVYSPQRLRRMLRDAGFIRVKYYGNLDGDPYNADAPRLVAVARKPKSKR